MKRPLFVPTVLALCLVLASLAGGSVSAQSGNMWHLEYYPNLDWAGNPAFIQDTSWLWIDWGSGAPGPNMPSSNWTMRATSNVYFYGGTVRFQIQADDEFVLYVDNQVRANTIGQGGSGKTYYIDVPVYQGNHNVRIDFRQYTGPASLYVNWSYISGGSPPPPPPYNPAPSNPSGYPTLPASASSVQTQYGNYDQCIQQNIHQVNCFVPNGWDTPNEGSIAGEPKIEVWGNCTKDQVSTFWVPSLNNTKDYKCSKTEAGWFPN